MYKPLGSSTYGTPSAGASLGSQGGLEGLTAGSSNSRVQGFAQEMASEGVTSSAEIKKRGLANGFTLVELMVVISIISVLMAVLLPSLGRARELSRQTVCASNLSQIGKALYQYGNEQTSGRFPVTLNPASNSSNLIWNGTKYFNFGALYNVHLGKSAKSLYCPSQGGKFTINDSVTGAVDSVTGASRIGRAGVNVQISYFMRGMPQGAPIGTNELSRKVVGDDYFHQAAAIYNHPTTPMINSLYNDGSVTPFSIQSTWDANFNIFGADTLPVMKDGAWSQLDRNSPQ